MIALRREDRVEAILPFSSASHGTLPVIQMRYGCFGIGEPLARNRTGSLCQVLPWSEET